MALFGLRGSSACSFRGFAQCLGWVAKAEAAHEHGGMCKHLTRAKARKAGVSFIASDIEINGDVAFTGKLYVAGKLTGRVSGTTAEAVLFVTATGRIEGEIDAPVVVVNGAVEGAVHAGVRIELAPQARVRGPVHYRGLEIHLGATLNGQLVPSESLEATD